MLKRLFEDEAAAKTDAILSGADLSLVAQTEARVN